MAVEHVTLAGLRADELGVPVTHNSTQRLGIADPAFQDPDFIQVSAPATVTALSPTEHVSVPPLLFSDEPMVAQCDGHHN